MKITYLHHSGFAAEFENFVLLFDAITCPRIDFKGKRIYFLASHSHGDHFSKEIFSYTDNKNTVYILSDDIRNYKKSKNVISVAEYKEYRFSDFTLNTFGSTDIGVSFYIASEKYKIFHSGDLNWWHWDGDSAENNIAAEREYKRHIYNLSKFKVNIAFVPSDPRLGRAYDYSVNYFIDNIKPDILIPMHFWDDYSIPKKLLRKYAEAKVKILDISAENSVIFRD
jgi:L-ascorbate metabolism protein UlaG (beta-lactamase superfamily)